MLTSWQDWTRALRRPESRSVGRRQAWCGACRAARARERAGRDAWFDDCPTSPGRQRARCGRRRTAAGWRARRGRAGRRASPAPASRGCCPHERTGTATYAPLPRTPLVGEVGEAELLAREELRVLADQVLDLGLGPVVESVVRRAHVGELRVAALRRDAAGVQQGILRRDRLERA